MASEFRMDAPCGTPALAPRSRDLGQGQKSDQSERERKRDSDHRSDPSSLPPGAPGTITWGSAEGRRSSLLLSVVPDLF